MKRQRASILVGLLWCLTLLGVVVISVLHLARLDLMVVKNQGDSIQAHYLALAGIEKAKALLYRDMMERKRSEKSHSGELYDLPEHFREAPFARGHFTVFRQGGADEGGKIMYGITDEESRLNINHASSEQLSKIDGMTPELVAAIRDWRDEDNAARTSGAEAEYYISLRNPYLPRNGPIQTIRELLMVRGVTRDLLSGEDANQNGLLDPEEDDKRESLPDDDGNGILDMGLSGLLTIDSSAENVDAAGEQRVNIKTADERTLSGIPGLSADLAKAIVAYRNQNEFETIADLLDVRAVNQQGSSQSSSSQRSARDPDSSGPRSANPPRSSSQPAPPPPQSSSQPEGPRLINQDLLIEIGDHITADDNTDQPGAININTASVEVLQCVPGVTRELAQAIVAYRKSAGFYANVAALLKVDGMTRDIFKQVASRFCTRSQTFRILSEGQVTSSGARKRIEMIVRLSGSDIETLSYREDL
jgi:competence ComEA-like helix-hairpin-helix protein